MLTAGGVALGCHSRPAFEKFPTSSFFLVSTEITGCPVARNRFAVALIVLELLVAVRMDRAFLPFAHDCNR